MKAWQTYGLDGIWVLPCTEYNPTAENPISFLTVDHYEGSGSLQKAILRYNHSGGPMGLRLHEETGSVSNNCGSLYYTLEFTGDPNMDHDNDGLPDTLETTGFRDGLGNWYHTDPHNNDTDGDGLTDGQEAGQLMTNSAGQKYYNLISDPTKVDTDGDGLTDYEEVHGSTIYVVNSRGSALNFMNALKNGTDPMPYLAAVNATSNPLKTDSDADGIDDGDEIAMGTNPNNADTDGDHILDNLEPIYGEDPTIFEIKPPVITYNGRVWKDSMSPTVKYYFDYGASDLAGVKDLSLRKNNIQIDGYTYPPGKYNVSEHTYFETDWETFLDALRGSQVTINSNDQNNNPESVLAYHRSSQYGMWAAQLGSDTIQNKAIAGDLGMLSGGSAVIAQIPEFAVQVSNDPVGYLNGMKNLASSIYSDPTLLGQLIASLPQSVKDQEELENPYSLDNPLHNSFANGWYSGYIAMSLATMYLGNEALKGITSSEQFVSLTSPIVNQADKIKAFLKASATLDSFALFVADESGTAWITDFASLFSKIKTFGKDVSFSNALKILQGSGISDEAIRGYLSDISEIADVKGYQKFVTKIIQEKVS